MMTTATAAEILHVSVRRVQYMVRSGLLPAKRNEDGAWVIEAKSVEACKGRKPGRPRKIHHAFIIEP